MNASDGSIVWQYATGGDVDANPLVINGVVYIGSLDDNLYALDEATGALLWNTDLGSEVFASAASKGDGLVYANSAFDGVYALDATTGAVVWNYALSCGFPGCIGTSSPRVFGKTVYVGLGPDVLALRANDGTIVWGLQTGRHGVVDAPLRQRVRLRRLRGRQSLLDQRGQRQGQVEDEPRRTTSTPRRSSHTAWSGPAPNSGQFFGLQLSNGRIKFSKKTGGIVYASPAAKGQQVLIASEDAKVYSFQMP